MYKIDGNGMRNSNNPSSDLTFTMSNVFFYEPFYDFDRLFEEAHARQQGAHGQGLQRSAPGEGAVRLVKPRFISLSTYQGQ